MFFRSSLFIFCFFFVNDPSTTEIYALSLHAALPISWLYPVSQSVGMNVDLGMNLHYFAGQIAVESTQGRVVQNYRSAIPMFYASALFDLPFKGLSARIDGGSQINVQWDKLFTSFDYKASLRDRKSTRLNSSHIPLSRMPSSA